MNKMTVTIFRNEVSAYKGLLALKTLHNTKDITLYASAIVVNDPAGMTLTRQATEDGPVGTPLNLFTEALVGLLSNPMGKPAIIGSAFRLDVEELTGPFIDLGKGGVDYGFVQEISKAMKPETILVLADVDETWVTPLNMKMDELGGKIFRKLRYEVVEHQFLAEIDAYRDEMKSLKQEMKRLNFQSENKMGEQIDLLERRISTLMKRAEDKLHRAEDEINSKLEKLNQQIIESAGEKKERLIQNIHKLKAEFAEKKNKMDEALDHARQALFPM